MTAVSMSGQDTVSINDRVLTDYAVGNIAELTFPSQIASAKTGKNGNSVYGKNESGRQCEVKIILLRSSDDDKFMNNLLQQQQADFASFVLVRGQFIKKVGDGKGNVSSDTYIMSGGVFTKQQEAKTNTDGDVDQSVSIYTLVFTNAPRAIT